MKLILFPHSFKAVGWCMFIPALIAGVWILTGNHSLYGIAETVVYDAVIIAIAVGALFIVCSRERIEDEMTKSIRLASLLNSLYIYIILLVTGTLFINGINYFYFLIVNLALMPVIFVLVFGLEIRRYNKLSEDEE